MEKIEALFIRNEQMNKQVLRQAVRDRQTDLNKTSTTPSCNRPPKIDPECIY